MKLQVGKVGTFLHTCTDAVLVVSIVKVRFGLDATYSCGFTLPKLYHTSDMGKVQENTNQSGMFHRPCISEVFMKNFLSQFILRTIRQNKLDHQFLLVNVSIRPIGTLIRH